MVQKEKEKIEAYKAILKELKEENEIFKEHLASIAIQVYATCTVEDTQRREMINIGCNLQMNNKLIKKYTERIINTVFYIEE